MREVRNHTIEMPRRPGYNHGQSLNGAATTYTSEEPIACAETMAQYSGEVSIVIADPMAITSELLMAALSKRSEFSILGCAKSIEELIVMLSTRGPDIVLIRNTSQSGTFSPLIILSATYKVSPGTRSIVLSNDLGPDEVVSYFQAQARGMLPADITDFETLCKCIYSVHQGQIWASSKQLNYLIDSLSGPKPVQIVDAKGDMVLSVREQEVLNLLAEGRSNRAMAEVLNLSEHTIKNHLFHIFYKLGVSNRTEAILCAMRQRTVPESRSAS